MCSPPQSQASLCASHHGVKLPWVYITLRGVKVTKFLKKNPRCASHCGVRLRGVLPTAESDSAVCITPLSQAPRCASYHGVKLRRVHHTAESKCTLLSQNRNLYESLGAVKRTIRRNPFRGEQFYHVRKDLKKKKILFAKTKIFTLRVMHTAESNFSNFVIKYLGEIETEF